jgi:DNA mismatch endonuclease (patch repair protein)
MRAIKSAGNRSTELRLRALVARSAIRGWKMHASALAGSPDFYFPVERVAVFIDGCFWHGCPRCGHTPKTNRPYWRKKLARNKQRDAQITRTLRSDGIRVLRLWECQLREKPSPCLKRLLILLGPKPDRKN